jgi:SAM-dependent methyltransferase
VPHAIVGDARRRGIDLRATCLDRSAQMLAIAQRRTGNDGGLTFVCGEGERLPFGDGAFDVVTCSLALHHFEPAAARALLRELRRVARLTPIVGDLTRSALAFALTWTYARLTTRNRLTRHDAPLSVRRAYAPHEAVELARAAGWRAPRVRREPFFRMTLTDG